MSLRTINPICHSERNEMERRISRVRMGKTQASEILQSLRSFQNDTERVAPIRYSEHIPQLSTGGESQAWRWKRNKWPRFLIRIMIGSECEVLLSIKKEETRMVAFSKFGVCSGEIAE